MHVHVCTLCTWIGGCIHACRCIPTTARYYVHQMSVFVCTSLTVQGAIQEKKTSQAGFPVGSIAASHRVWMLCTQEHKRNTATVFCCVCTGEELSRLPRHNGRPAIRRLSTWSASQTDRNPSTTWIYLDSGWHATGKLMPLCAGFVGMWLCVSVVRCYSGWTWIWAVMKKRA